MKDNKGFTLMEILLAALIVGVIGIALAALTTAAVREGGVGRTKVMLRQQLSLALRQIRQDIEQSTSVSFGDDPEKTGVPLELTQDYKFGPNHLLRQIVYKFESGTIVGAGDEDSRTGGIIYRQVNGGPREVLLANVKSIVENKENPASGFVSPSVSRGINGTFSSMVRLRVIVEVPTEPVVNDVIEETFMLPQGTGVR